MHNPSPSPLLAAAMCEQVHDLLAGEHEQHLPQVIAVLQPREPPRRRAGLEAVEGTQRNIFLVGSPAGVASKAGPRKTDQSGEIPLPNWLQRFGIAILDLL